MEAGVHRVEQAEWPPSGAIIPPNSTAQASGN